MVAEQDVYTAPIPYLIGTFIREYDISKANINILLSKGAISIQQYQYLYNAPKLVREITIGKMRRDNPKLSVLIKDGIRESRLKLVGANNLNDNSILSIKNDAVFVIDRKLQTTKFGNVEFAHKNTYSSFYKVYNMEFYYCSSNGQLDVKGMGDSTEIHREYMGDLLTFLLYEIEKKKPDEFLDELKQCMDDYVSLKYPLQMYREFNNRSLFKSKMIINDLSYYFSELAPNTDPMCLDISYNFGILSTLYSITISRILSSRR